MADVALGGDGLLGLAVVLFGALDRVLLVDAGYDLEKGFTVIKKQ